MLTEQRLNRVQSVVSMVERRVNATLSDRSAYCSRNGSVEWANDLRDNAGIERYEVCEALSILRTRVIRQWTGNLAADTLRFIDDLIDRLGLEPVDF